MRGMGRGGLWRFSSGSVVGSSYCGVFLVFCLDSSVLNGGR